jgi:hypothetical protein
MERGERKHDGESFRRILGRTRAKEKGEASRFRASNSLTEKKKRKI